LKFLKIETMWVIQNKGVRRFLLWTAILALASGWPACSSKKKAPAPASLLGSPSEPGPVVLQVGSMAYRTADFVRYVDISIGQGGRKLGALALSQLFDEFVDDKLLLQAAVSANVSLSPGEKDEFLKKLREEGWTAEEESAALGSDEGPLSDRLKVEKYVFGLVKDRHRRRGQRLLPATQGAVFPAGEDQGQPDPAPDRARGRRSLGGAEGWLGG
jgi:hypothetical protein